MHECRSCWTVTGTGRREWAQLDAAERRGFLLQPLYVAILVLLLAVAAAICGLLVASDRAAVLLLVAKVGGAAFLVVFALMELRALLHVAASVRRTKRAASNR